MSPLGSKHCWTILSVFGQGRQPSVSVSARPRLAESLAHWSIDRSLPFAHQELMSFLYSHTYIRRSLVVGRLLQIKQNQAHAKVGGNVNPEGRPRENRITANGGEEARGKRHSPTPLVSSASILVSSLQR